jgi:hypothetical protein
MFKNLLQSSPGKINWSVLPIDNRDSLLIGMARLPCFRLSSYVASHQSAVALQSGTKDLFKFVHHCSGLIKKI